MLERLGGEQVLKEQVFVLTPQDLVMGVHGIIEGTPQTCVTLRYVIGSVARVELEDSQLGLLFNYRICDQVFLFDHPCSDIVFDKESHESSSH